MITAAAVIVPTAIFAWGPDRPTYTIENPADHITFNSITNNPNIGDERNFVGIREVGSTNVWYDTMNVQPGKEYYVRMYVHNNAASSLNLVATNVRAQFILPTNTAKSIEVNGILTADNATPNKIWDQATFISGQDFNLAYVSGSLKYENNVFGSAGTALPESIFTSTGALLGYDKLDGRIPGCFQYAGYVTFIVKPQFAAQPDMEIAKTVRKSNTKEWNKSVKVNPGDTVDYQIYFKNTGQVRMNNVMVKDTLPAGVTYVAGSTYVVNSSNPGGIQVGDGITTTGINIGEYAPGANAYIKFTARVAGNDNLPECGSNTLRNTVRVEGDYGYKDDTADVTVDKTCVSKKPSYDLGKKVDKSTAKPGETIKYTLTFKNTGEIDLTNIVIKDQLPSGINWTNVDINVTNGSGISDKDKLFTTGVKVAQVNVGGTVVIKITAKVANDAVEAKECGENKKTFVNKSSAVTNEKQTEDRTDNNEASTVVTVNKDCTYSYDLIKTGPKTAKPGETVTYTLTFKNTGNQALTNVVVKDMLPSGVTYIAGSTTVDGAKTADGVTTSNGLNIGTVAAGKTVVIKFQAKMPGKDALACGDNKFVNKSSAVTKEKQTEDRTDNNEATTNVNKDCPPVKEKCKVPGKEHLDKDDPACKPDEKPKCDIPGKEHLDKNDPNCVIVTNVTPPPAEPPSKGYTPEYIVATGPVQTIAGIIAAGALTFGGVAYLRSRRALKNSML